MTDMPNIGVTIRQQRQRLCLSLDEAAQRTGVSKAMLGQIERGESNPTVSTLWKISSGLKLTFSDLMERQDGALRVVRQTQITPVREAEGHVRLYDVFPFDPQAGFECFYIEIDAGCSYPSPGHENVREEYVMVAEGTLCLEVDGEPYTLEPGNSLRFGGTAAHTYNGAAAGRTAFFNIIRY